MIRRLFALLILSTGVYAGAAAQATPEPVSTPAPLTSGNNALARFSGQVLDYRKGFIFFTTGDGFRVAADVHIINLSTGAAAAAPHVRQYARATFSPQGLVVEIALSARPLPPEASYEVIRQYAVTQTAKQSNPDFKKHAVGIEGKPVLVTFIVTVPPTTPLTDQIYMSTDKSGWQPNAIRMDRVDAMRYRYTVKLNSGTEIDYLFTRGTWTTVERGQNGLEQRPHHIFVNNLDTENRSNQVYYWADQGASGGAPNAQATFNPAALPTPFNPSPFNFPTPRPVPTHAAS